MQRFYLVRHFLILLSSTTWIVGMDNTNSLCDAICRKDFDSAKGILIYCENVNAKDHDGYTPLHHALGVGSESIFNTLLNRYEINVNVQDPEGYTPLHYAVKRNSETMVKSLLMVRGIDATIKSNRGVTPLDVARQNNFGTIVRLLLEHQNKIDTRSQTSSNNQDNTAIPASPNLHDSVSRGNAIVIDNYLRSGGDVNYRDTAGWTFLHRAVYSGQMYIINVLLSTPGVDVNAQDNRGYTPLHRAVQNCNEAIVKILLSAYAIDTTIKDKEGLIPLDIAFQNQFHTIVKLLEGKSFLEQQEREAQAPSSLHEAAVNGNIEDINKLLSLDVDVNAYDKDGWTALHHAAYYGYGSVIKTLLAAPGIKINALTNERKTALHLAGIGGFHEEVIKLLLNSQGIDVNAQDDTEWTPLHYVLYYGYQGYEEIVEQLLAAGALPKIGREGNTPLDLARQYGREEIFNKCIDKGNTSMSLHEAAISKNFLILNRLLREGVDINSQAPNGLTALHCAVAKGHEDVVKFLIAHPDIRVNVQEETGCTPLHLAAYLGHESSMACLLRVDAIKINIQNNDQWTPLHCAIAEAHECVVRQLLNVGGIDLKIKNDEGLIPLEMARKKGFDAIVKLLEASNNKLAPAAPILAQRNAPLVPQASGQNPVLCVALKPSAMPAQVSNVEKEQECSICCESFAENPDKKKIFLGCGHVFHKECIDPWFRDRKECPECRSNPEDLDANGLDKKLFMAVMQNELDQVEELLKRGADSNSDHDGMTPLMVAVYQGKTDAVHRMLQYSGINSIKNLDKCVQVTAQNKSYEIMLALIEQGAIIDPKNNVLVKALGEAFQNNPFLFAILMADQLIVTQLLKQNESNMLKKALRYAIAQGSIEIVGLLLAELSKRGSGLITPELLGYTVMLAQRTLSNEYKIRYEKIIQLLHEATERLRAPFGTDSGRNSFDERSRSNSECTIS